MGGRAVPPRCLASLRRRTIRPTDRPADRVRLGHAIGGSPPEGGREGGKALVPWDEGRTKYVPIALLLLLLLLSPAT